ncbi:MAG: hypothetical protein SWE60_26020, partial [Thermodesulfobacteriota bacterium]|nr:hypothetical protein [Thermodesulfobacteriota bacterium]
MPKFGQVLPIMHIRVRLAFIDYAVVIFILFTIKPAVSVGIAEKRIGRGGWIKVCLENTPIGIGPNVVQGTATFCP